ncbi:UDP-glucuronosyltransferase [Insulibacter thermoxylanivorax]|uniref:UDP-glucuronosyltransferase n=1 Tax=Insulibacter thermoxylanivorax TaxID=2749268 RepID=A0A916VGW3_9BACL|nr:glycosyltransferase [Insulibacter thermoxylanivorax]GFR38961.1 UDP-glucuronosyltransferase [Insulibacter thermoxylanivorax]
MRKRRVLLLSEGFGTGHTRAAHAISKGISTLSPDIITKVLELGAFLHPTIAPMIFKAYRKTVINRPKLYSLLYRSQYNKSLNRVAQLALHRIFYAQTANVIEQLRPDVVISTHPFPSTVISRLKRIGLKIPLCTVITDYDAHGTWMSSGTNLYLVSTADVRDKLIAKGVAKQKIEVTGIPVHPDFWYKHNRKELLVELNLRDLPTVLVMGGGWGIMSSVEMLEYMVKWREQVQFILCLGDNEKAREELLENPVFRHPNIHVLGYTNQVHKLMDVADLLVTKPGGMTSTEAMAKKLPMLFYDAIPGQEEENLQYFIKNGIAEMIDGQETIAKWLNMLVSDKEEYEHRRRIFESSVNAYRPQRCVERILQFLDDAIEADRTRANA